MASDRWPAELSTLGVKKCLWDKKCRTTRSQDSSNPTSSRSSLVILYALEIRELISV